MSDKTKEAKPNECSFDSPTREDIAVLFKNEELFERREAIIDFVFNAVKEPSLMGLDYADIIKVADNKSRFNIIKAFSDKIDKYQSYIDSSDGVIVVLTGGSGDTLGLFNDILQEHFSKPKLCVPIGFINEKNHNGNPLLEVVLASR